MDGVQGTGSEYLRVVNLELDLQQASGKQGQVVWGVGKDLVRADFKQRLTCSLTSTTVQGCWRRSLMKSMSLYGCGYSHSTLSLVRDVRVRVSMIGRSVNDSSFSVEPSTSNRKTL